MISLHSLFLSYWKILIHVKSWNWKSSGKCLQLSIELLSLWNKEEKHHYSDDTSPLQVNSPRWHRFRRKKPYKMKLTISLSKKKNIIESMYTLWKKQKSVIKKTQIFHTNSGFQKTKRSQHYGLKNIQTFLTNSLLNKLLKYIEKHLNNWQNTLLWWSFSWEQSWNISF